MKHFIHGIMHDAGKLAQVISVISSGNQVPIPFRKYLLKYYQIECTGNDLLEMLLNDQPGMAIIHQHVVYETVFSGTEMLKATSAKQVTISFRQAKHYLGCPNYAVVSIKS